MNNFDQRRDQKIFEILSMIKVIYILLGIVAMMSSDSSRESTSFLLATYVAIVLFIAVTYFLWISNYEKKESNKTIKFRYILEIAILLAVFIIVISATGGYKSPYKFICIFIILIAAIQYGRDYSLGVAVLASVIILGADVIGSFLEVVNGSINSELGIYVQVKYILSSYFEADIVIISALLVTSYILGMYVNIEEEHSKELKTLVVIDELTGVFNHRYFQEQLTQSIYQASEDESSVSLLFMDIDYFKHYNDTNGHQAGDLVLRRVGEILKGSVREGDIVSRYGGEEFAVILPNTNEKHAIEVGERIRKAIAGTEFLGQENQPNRNITISIGVSSYPTRAKNKHQLINTADDALYRAKSFNKNRVEIYHNVLEEISTQMNVENDTVKSLKTFINMINIKDRYTHGHIERVVIYIKWFSEYLGLSSEDKFKLGIAAYLHDIGKLEIPEEILNKKDKLTEEEFNLLKSHPTKGVNLIKHIKEFKPCMPIIEYHHERYDGRGYPKGLKGEEIPYLSRVLTIADSFDAMTSNRPYNIRKSQEQGIEELRKNSGTQFDPYLVEAFILMLQKHTDNF